MIVEDGSSLHEQEFLEQGTVVFTNQHHRIGTDALLLSHEVTAYLLVVRAGVSHMSREKAAVTLLEQVDADICGILFNGLPPKSKDCNYRLQQYWQEYKQQNGEAV